MMLGLALGDTLGAARGELPATGALRAGVSTQLACFTVEGLIRAHVRGSHKGICHAPSVLWHAYCRWAALQGIEVEKMRGRWASSSVAAWPDGWLAQVGALGERRGSAPATVAALSMVEQGTLEKPTTTSRGCHALTRTLPVAALAMDSGLNHWAEEARAIAALTHGDRAAQSATVHAVVLAYHCLTSGLRQLSQGPTSGEPARDVAPVRGALEAAIAALPDFDRGSTDDERERLASAVRYGAEQPGDSATLARLAPDASAPSALLGGLYVAASFPQRTEFGAALRFAAKAPDADSVACVAGALLGAAHGVEALPVELVSRHELAWVLDTLARDLVIQVFDSPSGGAYVDGWDPSWWDRYPGW